MGFFSGLLDFIATLANQSANRIDRMSDEEIDTKYGESSSRMRESAQAAHQFHDIIRNHQKNVDD